MDNIKNTVIRLALNFADTITDILNTDTAPKMLVTVNDDVILDTTKDTDIT